jgi:uncharacterized protein (DUF433 family)
MGRRAVYPVTKNRSVMNGTPVFRGTRVPVQILVDYLEGGDRLDDFLDDFPSVTRANAIAVLEVARLAIVADARPAR